MAWEIDNTRPIYLQLMERIQLDIVTGVYKPGDKIPSVRELAMTAAVNPNTMQKALVELEDYGLVYPKRTSGRFITEDETLLTDMRQKMAHEKIRLFIDSMIHLGFEASEIPQLITDYKKEIT